MIGLIAVIIVVLAIHVLVTHLWTKFFESKRFKEGGSALNKNRG